MKKRTQSKNQISTCKLKEKKETQYVYSKHCPILQKLMSIFKPTIRRQEIDKDGGIVIETTTTHIVTANGEMQVDYDDGLNGADLDVFLAISAIAKDYTRRDVVGGESQASVVDLSEKDKEVMLDPFKSIKTKKSYSKGLINPKDEESRISEIKSASIVVSSRELALESRGQDGGVSLQSVRDSLLKLSRVKVRYNGKDWDSSFNLLSYFLCKATGVYVIAINPVFSYTIFNDQAHYRIVNREERSQLSHTAKAIHNYLSGVIFKGEVKYRMSVDNMIMTTILPQKTIDIINNKEMKKVVSTPKSAFPDDQEGWVNDIKSKYSAATLELRKARAKVSSALLTEISYLDNWGAEVSGRGVNMKMNISRRAGGEFPRPL